ncbi:MAG TPA: hypothetical protein VFV87_20215 [Pirellulaceae bacterium]|nr:hypothetical protein [Pirellulaceae bacterium]
MRRFFVSVAVAAALVSAAGAEQDPRQVEKFVAKGGEHWSAPAEISLGDSSVTGGKRLLVWPEGDKVFDVADKKALVSFHWMLLPGEAPFKRGQALRLSIHAPAEPRFFTSTTVQPEAGAREGMLRVMLPLEKCPLGGETELVLYLGLKEPQSNLLEIKVDLAPVAAAAPRPKQSKLR